MAKQKKPNKRVEKTLKRLQAPWFRGLSEDARIVAEVLLTKMPQGPFAVCKEIVRGNVARANAVLEEIANATRDVTDPENQRLVEAVAPWRT